MEDQQETRARAGTASLTGPAELDEILKQGYTRGRQGSHQAIERILHLDPAIKRADLWKRIRTLKGTSSSTPYQRRTWTPELLEILERGYARGRSGAREGVQEILRRYPALSRPVIWKHASRLGLTQHGKNIEAKNRRGPWSADEDKFLLQFGGEYPARMIGEKLHRSERAVRLRLFLQIGSSRVRDGFTQSELSRDLGVSPATVRRWVKMEWLKLRGRRITDKSFQEFCRAHGSEIDVGEISKEMKLWLTEEMGLIRNPDVKVPDKWHAIRKHARRARSCPRCARQIRGNAYYRHVKACRGKVGRVAGVSDGYF